MSLAPAPHSSPVSQASGGRNGALPSTSALAEARSSLWMAYQPIVDSLSKKLYGYEALVRNKQPSLSAPHNLFAAADAANESQSLGQQIRREVALDILRHPLPDACYVFVNLHASDLLDPSLFDARAPLSQHAERIIFEITERESLDGIEDVKARIERLRSLGFRIAIDDLGAGFAGLSTLAELAPEVVKLDMSLVRELHANARKRTIVECLVSLCRKLDVQLVAEGVETADERDLLCTLGCRWLQGYHFGRPQADFRAPSSF